MEKKISKNEPYPIEVQAGNTYAWCSCGLSKTQPFCDESHQLTDCMPFEFTATENKVIYFCGCKQTASPPLCDGCHRSL